MINIHISTQRYNWYAWYLGHQAVCQIILCSCLELGVNIVYKWVKLKHALPVVWQEKLSRTIYRMLTYSVACTPRVKHVTWSNLVLYWHRPCNMPASSRHLTSLVTVSSLHSWALKLFQVVHCDPWMTYKESTAPQMSFHRTTSLHGLHYRGLDQPQLQAQDIWWFQQCCEACVQCLWHVWICWSRW